MSSSMQTAAIRSSETNPAKLTLLYAEEFKLSAVKKGETIVGAFDNLAFNDIISLTQKFNIKNKKVEIDAMVAQLKEKYTSKQEKA